MKQVHDLKSEKLRFQEMWDGLKKHEVRVNDRNYQEGDLLILREIDDAKVYTDRIIVARVTNMTKGGTYGLPDGVCAMSINVLLRDCSNVGDDPVEL